MKNSGYFFRREPCPCCDSGPLVMIRCSRCSVVIGWCAELEYAVGRIEGGSLDPFDRGERPDWARRHCPACGGPVEDLGYADQSALQEAGLASRQLMWAAPDGSILEANPEW